MLTVTTGRLLTAPKSDDDNGISNLYDILGWMTNDEPYTHQLGRFMDECRPYLLRWFPELTTDSQDITKLNKLFADGEAKNESPQQAVEMWLAWMLETGVALKTSYDVPRIPRDDHTVRDPRIELIEMRGSGKGIVEIDPSNFQ